MYMVAWVSSSSVIWLVLRKQVHFVTKYTDAHAELIVLVNAQYIK